MLFSPEKREGKVYIKNEPFFYKIFLSPHNLSKPEQTRIIELFGNIRKPGETRNCLGITTEHVSTDLSTGMFECYILVENANHRNKYIDRGVATFKYSDICHDMTNRIIIYNVCRSTRNAVFNQEVPVSPKPEITPIFAIFDLIRRLAIEKRIHSMYLYVDESERGNIGHDHDKLTKEVYPKYGFKIDPNCPNEGYTTMRADFTTTTFIRDDPTSAQAKNVKKRVITRTKRKRQGLALTKRTFNRVRIGRKRNMTRNMKQK